MMFLTPDEFRPLNLFSEFTLSSKTYDDIKLSIRIHTDQEGIQNDLGYLDIVIYTMDGNYRKDLFTWNLQVHIGYLRDISRDISIRLNQVLTEGDVYCIERFKDNYFIFTYFSSQDKMYRIQAVQTRDPITGEDIVDPLPKDIRELINYTTNGINNRWINMSKREYRSLAEQSKRFADEINRYYYVLVHVFPGFGAHRNVEEESNNDQHGGV